MLPTIPDNYKPKNFWERPEGTTGLLTIGILGLSGFFILQAVLPTLIAFLGLAITAVGKTIVLGVLCAVLAAFLYVITNKKFLTLCNYIFKSAMRKVTGAFIEIDPIGIMKNYIDDAKGNLQEIDDGVEKLSGQVAICRRKVDANTAAYDKAIRTAAVAKEKGVNSQFTLNARQAGRLQTSNVTLSQLLQTMELHLRAMKKYREVSDTVIADLVNEVAVREDERKLILTSYSVLQSAKKILNGDPDKKELFDQAMEFVVSDYGQKLGEIEHFIETSKNFVEGLDLQNGVFEAEALKKIQEWESKADSILLGDSKNILIENANLDRIPMTFDSKDVIAAQQKDGSDYTKYFIK